MLVSSTLKNIRIYLEFVDRIDNSVPKVTVWHHEGLQSDPRDRFVSPCLKLMLDSFSYTYLGAERLELGRFYLRNLLQMCPPF